MTIPVKKRLLDVEEYQQMFEAGILTEREKVELIQGEILEMNPIGNQHAALVDRISNYLAYHLFEKAIVRVQNPIILDQHSEPEPDLTVLNWQSDYYRDQHPGPQDVLILIEVADSSLDYDREIKLPLYAAAGIPIVWIVDISQSVIEVYERPISGKYTQKKYLTNKDHYTIPIVDLYVSIQEILG